MKARHIRSTWLVTQTLLFLIKILYTINHFGENQKERSIINPMDNASVIDNAKNQRESNSRNFLYKEVKTLTPVI
jgi:hypothetical protein